MTTQLKDANQIRAEIRKNVEVVRPSKKLIKLLDSLKLNFSKLKKRVDEIFRVARAEGFPDDEIGKMIRMRMDGEYSEATIRRVLPSTAKAKTIAVNNAKKAFKMNASEQEKQSENNTTQISNDMIDTPEENQRRAQEEMETGEIEPGTAPQPTKATSATVVDPFRTYKDIIEAKNKIIKEKDEIIAGKDKIIAAKNKIIANQAKQIETLKKQVKK